MKKNNKKVARPRVSGKAKFLAVLLFLQAVFGWAKEQWAVVLRQVDHNNNRNINTSIYLDTNDDGFPDTELGLIDTTRNVVAMILRDLLQRGARISFDDSQMSTSSGMNYVDAKTLLTIDGESILDLFPPEFARVFPFAALERERTGR